MQTVETRSQFVQQLDGKRRALGLNNDQFAAYLCERGIPTSASKWSRIQNEVRLPRSEWAKKVCKLWPDLAAYWAADLLAA